MKFAPHGANWEAASEGADWVDLKAAIIEVGGHTRCDDDRDVVAFRQSLGERAGIRADATLVGLAVRGVDQHTRRTRHASLHARRCGVSGCASRVRELCAAERNS